MLRSFLAVAAILAAIGALVGTLAILAPVGSSPIPAGPVPPAAVP